MRRKRVVSVTKLRGRNVRRGNLMVTKMQMREIMIALDDEGMGGG